MWRSMLLLRWSALVAVTLAVAACGASVRTTGDSATADIGSSTTIEATTTALHDDVVVNRIPDQGDIVELPGVGVSGTIRRVERCVMLETDDELYGLLLPEVTEVDLILDALVLSGPDGRSYEEGDLVFFGGLGWGKAGAYVAMSEEAGLLDEHACGDPYAAWPYWSESCAIETLDDILDC